MQEHRVLDTCLRRGPHETDVGGDCHSSLTVPGSENHLKMNCD